MNFQKLESSTQRLWYNTNLPYNSNDQPDRNAIEWQRLNMMWDDPGVPISYRINSHGYRGSQFDIVDWDNSIICFGDSQMFGTGLAECHTIPGYLSAATGVNCVNFGECNGSNVFMSEQSVMLNLMGIKPRAIVLLTTSMFRTTWYFDHQRTHLNAWCTHDKTNLEFFKHWADNYDRVHYQSQLAFDTIKSNWSNIPIAMLTYDSDIEQYCGIEHIPRTIITNYARDGKHHSYATSKVISDRFLAMLAEQNFKF